MAEPCREIGVLDDAPPHEGQLAVELRGEVRENPDPVQARGERGHHDPPPGPRKHLLEPRHDVDLRPRETRPLDVGAVAEEGEHTLPSELREAVHVEGLTVDGGLVELEVAAVHDDAGRGVQGHRHAVRHAVGDPDQLEGDLADLGRAAGLQRAAALVGVEAVLGQLLAREGEGQGRAVHRSVQEGPDVGQGPDMVFVPVSQHHRREPADALFEVPEVGDDEVDAGQLGPREHRAGVDEDGGVPPGDEHHVHAELAEAAAGHDLERGSGRGGRFEHRSHASWVARVGPENGREGRGGTATAGQSDAAARARPPASPARASSNGGGGAPVGRDVRLVRAAPARAGDRRGASGAEGVEHRLAPLAAENRLRTQPLEQPPSRDGHRRGTEPQVRPPAERTRGGGRKRRAAGSAHALGWRPGPPSGSRTASGP